MVNKRVFNAYIIPAEEMNPIYTAQVAALILFLAILFIAAIFEIRGRIKTLITALSVIFVSINYYIYLSLLRYENIYIYPLIIIESYKENTVISPDLGQFVLILLIIIWRKELLARLNAIINMFRKRHAEKMTDKQPRNETEN